MNKTNAPKIPYNYAMCIMSNCPKAATCLRQVILADTDEKRLTILNPRMLDLKNQCTYYKPAQKVVYAKGMKNVMGLLPHDQHSSIANNLKLRFGERTYYRIRRGERLLNPNEQQAVRNLLAHYGFTQSWDFDAYEEDYLWD